MIAALLMAALFLVLRAIGERELPLFPVVVVNYFTATTVGLLHARPWNVGHTGHLVAPAALEGALFILFFHLMGVSARRAGVTVTTVASKMSLVITVIIAVLLFKEHPGAWGWLGIGAGVVGVVLTSIGDNKSTTNSWLLPLIIFIGSACTDTVINVVQRTHLTPLTEAVFTTYTFAAAGCIGLVVLLFHAQRRAVLRAEVVRWGVLLGLVNYGSIQALVHALTSSGLPSAHVFPLLNIATILIGTAAAMLLFKERLSLHRWIGVGCCVLGMVLIMFTAR